MKSVYFIVCVTMLAALPGLSQADIYKWKDKDGNTRYSDTPPPSNIKLENIGTKKVASPTGKEPLSAVPQASAPQASQPVTSKEAVLVTPPRNEQDVAAEQRQRNAEADKKNKQEKEAQAKIKAENCSAAKSNLASYAQGGRIYKMNEKGEREYMDDAGLKQGADKARGEVAQYCS
jgi:hypothetical protein